MLILYKIIFLLQINIYLNYVSCIKNLESNLVLEEKTDKLKNQLLEKVLGPNYKSAVQYDVKDNKPLVQVITGDEVVSNNNNKHPEPSNYQNMNRQLNQAQHNYAQHNRHQHGNNYSNKMSLSRNEQEREIFNIRNNHKRDNYNQIKKPCSGKKNKQDEQPTPTYFYPKHTKGELVVHNPAPIIVERPPTKVVVNHPAIVVRPHPVLINRAPQAINPVMVYKPPPAAPAEPLKIRPVFVKFESSGPSSHHHSHHQYLRGRHESNHNGGHHESHHSGHHESYHGHHYDEDNDSSYGEGTHFHGSPYYNHDDQSYNNHGYSTYNG